MRFGIGIMLHALAILIIIARDRIDVLSDALPPILTIEEPGLRFIDLALTEKALDAGHKGATALTQVWLSPLPVRKRSCLRAQLLRRPIHTRPASAREVRTSIAEVA